MDVIGGQVTSILSPKKMSVKLNFSGKHNQQSFKRNETVLITGINLLNTPTSALLKKNVRVLVYERCKNGIIRGYVLVLTGEKD